MKKLTILGILVTLYPALSYGQAVYSVDDILEVRGSDIIYDKNRKPLTGKVVYVENNEKKFRDTHAFALPGANSWSVCHKMELSVKNGKKDGKMKCYDKEDALEKEYDFKDGYLDGMVIEYDTYHPGEISEKSEYKMNRCVHSIHYRDNKPTYGFKAINNPKQQRISKVTGLPITDLPAKKVEGCSHENSWIERYHEADGKLFVSMNPVSKEKNYYTQDGRVYFNISPVEEKYKSKADFICTAYYEDNKPMLRLTLKDNKVLGGEFYSRDGQKNILDNQKATDYFTDVILSINLGV